MDIRQSDLPGVLEMTFIMDSQNKKIHFLTFIYLESLGHVDTSTKIARSDESYFRQVIKETNMLALIQTV